jgi:hypothetical protein
MREGAGAPYPAVKLHRLGRLRARDPARLRTLTNRENPGPRGPIDRLGTRGRLVGASVHLIYKHKPALEQAQRNARVIRQRPTARGRAGCRFAWRRARRQSNFHPRTPIPDRTPQPRRLQHGECCSWGRACCWNSVQGERCMDSHSGTVGRTISGERCTMQSVVRSHPPEPAVRGHRP